MGAGPSLLSHSSGSFCWCHGDPQPPPICGAAVGPGVRMLPTLLGSTSPQHCRESSSQAGTRGAWLCCSQLWGGLQAEDTAQQESVWAGVCSSIMQWPQLSTGLVSEAVLVRARKVK